MSEVQEGSRRRFAPQKGYNEKRERLMLKHLEKHRPIKLCRLVNSFLLGFLDKMVAWYTMRTKDRKFRET